MLSSTKTTTSNQLRGPSGKQQTCYVCNHLCWLTHHQMISKLTNVIVTSALMFAAHKYKFKTPSARNYSKHKTPYKKIKNGGRDYVRQRRGQKRFLGFCFITKGWPTIGNKGCLTVGRGRLVLIQYRFNKQTHAQPPSPLQAMWVSAEDRYAYKCVRETTADLSITATHWQPYIHIRIYTQRVFSFTFTAVTQCFINISRAFL